MRGKPTLVLQTRYLSVTSLALLFDVGPSSGSRHRAAYWPTPPLLSLSISTGDALELPVLRTTLQSDISPGTTSSYPKRRNFYHMEPSNRSRCAHACRSASRLYSAALVGFVLSTVTCSAGAPWTRPSASRVRGLSGAFLSAQHMHTKRASELLSPLKVSYTGSSFVPVNHTARPLPSVAVQVRPLLLQDVRHF